MLLTSLLPECGNYKPAKQGKGGASWCHASFSNFQPRPVSSRAQRGSLVSENSQTRWSKTPPAFEHVYSRAEGKKEHRRIILTVGFRGAKIALRNCR
jgi:hypothetical protein